MSFNPRPAIKHQRSHRATDVRRGRPAVAGVLIVAWNVLLGPLWLGVCLGLPIAIGMIFGE